MRPRPTLADYAVIAISPMLIMFMVGSLVFFLIEVFYGGQFALRLQVIMGLFVMAAVLIGRISIEEGREYASLFAIALGIVTAIATLRFVQFQGPLASISPLVSLSLVGLIWWSADKLTWDCTVIDEQQDASGEGLLQTTGLDGDSTQSSRGACSGQAPLDGTTSREPPPAFSWWHKFVEYRRRPHSPGVWVLYFSLAALPMFGFGQWFAPQDLASRRYVFQLLVVYLASGLGLLLTTSFLGLRRYLRQRRLAMPVEMAGSWFGVGAVLIGAVLLLCMLLPRRNPEYSVTHLPVFAGSRQLDPAEMGFGDDGPQDSELANRQVSGESENEAHQAGDPAAGGQSQNGGSRQQDQTSGRQRGKGGEQSNRENRKRGNQPQGNQQQDGQQQDDRSRGRQQRGNQSQDDGGSRQSQQQQGGQARDGEHAQSDKSRGQTEKQQDASRSESPGDRQRDRKDAMENGEQRRSADSQQARRQNSPPSGTTQLLSNLGRGLGGLIKLIYWLAAVGIVVFFMWRYWPQVVAAVHRFIRGLQDLWDRLWGRQATQDEPAAAEAATPSETYRRFADYPNPFLTGAAERFTPPQLVRYSFEAFEAWSRERGWPRDPDQTPHEFAQCVVRAERSLAKEAPRLAELYCWTAYGKDSLPESALEHVRRFWARVGESPQAK